MRMGRNIVVKYFLAENYVLKFRFIEISWVFLKFGAYEF